MRDEERITSHHFRIVGIKCFCAVKTHRSCCPGDLVWQSAHTQGLHLSIGAPVQNPTIEFLPCSSRATFKMTFQMWAGENRTTSAPTILYVVSACYPCSISCSLVTWDQCLSAPRLTASPVLEIIPYSFLPLRKYIKTSSIKMTPRFSLPESGSSFLGQGSCFLWTLLTSPLPRVGGLFLLISLFTWS